MARLLAALFFVVLTISAPTQLLAQAASSSSYQTNNSSFMRIYGTARPPYGYVRFCNAQPSYCETQGFQEKRFFASPQRLSELDRVNRTVNSEIKPLTDQEIYGISEYWALPAGMGDCEDFALLKRDVLIRHGWPPSALLLTVVRDEQGDGHAVLTARTAQGDFVLDNKISDVRIWHETPYEFVMRQSYVNPKVWVSLDKAYVAGNALQAGTSVNR